MVPPQTHVSSYTEVVNSFFLDEKTFDFSFYIFESKIEIKMNVNFFLFFLQIIKGF